MKVTMNKKLNAEYYVRFSHVVGPWSRGRALVFGPSGIVLRPSLWTAMKVIMNKS